MKTRILLFLLAASLVVLPGCGKLRQLLHRKSAPPAAAAATPAAAVTKAPAAAPRPAEATPTAAPAVTANRNASVIVLCYHRFEDMPHNYLAIKPAEFEAQMKAIKDNGFTVIPLKDFLAWRRGEKEIPAKSALITIDDGYLSGYTVAWPILKRMGYPFTMFVYVQYIGTGGKSLSWDQLAEMRDAGVEIACHSWTHQDLHGKGISPREPSGRLALEDIKQLGYDGWVHKEIVESKQLLEKNLALKVSAFAYPYGKYTPKARELVKQAGYEAAFSVYGQAIGFSNPPSDLIGRYAISTKEPHIFQLAMSMAGGGSTGYASAAATPVMSQLAAASMVTEPMEGETVSDPKPVIKANLATMGAIDAGTVEMRISGFGAVAAKYDPETKTISYQPTTQPLRDKNYTVLISAKVGGKHAETRWSFNFDPNAAPAAGGAAPGSNTKAAAPAQPSPIGAAPAAPVGQQTK